MEIFLMMFVFYYMYMLNIFMNLINPLIIFLIISVFCKFSFLGWWDMNLYFGLNVYSFGLVILSLMILMVILTNLSEAKCIFLIMAMFSLMILNFLSLNLLLYYFMYESSLVMIYYLIMNWSHSIFKSLVSYMLIFYTLLFSLPMLLIITMVLTDLNSLSFIILEVTKGNLGSFLMFYLMLGFMVKIPVYLLHGWLLKAHVEAPYFGSMILASVMLKLGGYGLLRILLMFNSSVILKDYLIFVNILGMLILSVVCLQQVDMKLLIAMSSVVHMGLMISSLCVFDSIGVKGGYLVMVSHGFSSSGLFYLVNEVYKCSKTRLMVLNKGAMSFMPVNTMMWFLLCTSNSAAPLSLNLFSEIFMLTSLLNYSMGIFIFLVLYCFFSFMYSIYLFSYVQHGQFEVSSFYMKGGKLISFFTSMYHWLPLNFGFLFLMIV